MKLTGIWNLDEVSRIFCTCQETFKTHRDPFINFRIFATGRTAAYAKDLLYLIQSSAYRFQAKCIPGTLEQR